MSWQVIRAQANLEEPEYSATLEYLGTGYEHDYGDPIPGDMTYYGDGLFSIDPGGGNGANEFSEVFFHMCYKGPAVVYPNSSYIVMNMEQLSGYLDSTWWDGNPKYSYHGEFLTADAWANSGAQPHTRFGRTYNELWTGSSEGGGTSYGDGEWTSDNLPGYQWPHEHIGMHFERKNQVMGYYRQFAALEDVWFNPAIIYSLCTTTAYFKIHSISLYEHWPHPTDPPNLLMQFPPFSALPLQIAASTTNTPIVITTAKPHGWSSDNWVTVSGHLVNTAANGTWRIIVIDDKKFSLDGSVGIAAGGATGTVVLKG